ncbi:MAG: adenylate kinase [Ignavibacteriales bacterium CG12_big_fil_rev_8_21_14_0_65_30_8]|nr:MAG: adenylate kinase [Ignavibacteriales bacterium CG12_big_fil_rev_8_21_14_0_65_30_8]
MRILLFGMPGVGKGTQAKILSSKLNIPHISTGEILRQAVRDETELGKKAKEIMNEGELVPDSVMIGIIKETFSQPRCKDGFILDGFPRTKIQAEELDELIDELKLSNVVVLSITAPVSEILKRLTDRLACKNCKSIFTRSKIEGLKSCPKCNAENSFYQRKDDTEDVIKNRIEIFNNVTKAVLEYYRDKREVITIDGNDTVENVNKEILDTLSLKYDKIKN